MNTHEIIPNGPSVYRSFEENDDTKNSLINRPTYRKKKHHPKIVCSIGEFHKVHHRSMLNKYAYHRTLVFLLGKMSAKLLEMKLFWLS